MSDREEKRKKEGEDGPARISARQVFGERADRYAELDVFSEEKFYRPLIELADPRPADRVLDLASGTGLLALMAARKAGEVIGSDITPEMLEKARERAMTAGVENVRYVEAGVAALPFADDSFDLVTCRLAFHHFPDPDTALAEIHRVLKPCGRFVMEDVFGPEDNEIRATRERLEKLFDPSHVLAYTDRELRTMLQAAAFRVVKVFEPHTKGLPVEFLLKLERVEDPESRAEIVRLLQDNLDSDLGGLRATENEGDLVLTWRTIIIASIKE